MKGMNQVMKTLLCTECPESTGTPLYISNSLKYQYYTSTIPSTYKLASYVWFL